MIDCFNSCWPRRTAGTKVRPFVWRSKGTCASRRLRPWIVFVEPYDLTVECSGGGMPNAELTCVDTSAWVEFFRDRPHPVVQITRDLLMRAQVCLADVVIGELFQGVRTPRERAAIEECVETLPTLSGKPQTWQEAGLLSAQARTRGKTLHLVDCYLAALAAEHHVQLLTCDRHVEHILPLLPRLEVLLL